jgi:hypothetical protein
MLFGVVPFCSLLHFNFVTFIIFHIDGIQTSLYSYRTSLRTTLCSSKIKISKKQNKKRILRFAPKA